MSRVAKPTDLNCTARERFRVLTGEASSFGGTDTHTNITQADSIVNRVAMALKALGAPWSSWLGTDGSPRWANIIIAGCVPSFGADAGALAGKMIWTRIYEHMLTAPIDAALGSATVSESCACVAPGAGSKTLIKTTEVELEIAGSGTVFAMRCD